MPWKLLEGMLHFSTKKIEVFIDNIYCFIHFHIRMHESYGLLNKEHLGSDLLETPRNLPLPENESPGCQCMVISMVDSYKLPQCCMEMEHMHTTDTYGPRQASGITLGLRTSYLFPDTSQMSNLQEITAGRFQALGIYMNTGKGPWGRLLQGDNHRPGRVNDNMGLLCLLQT